MRVTCSWGLSVGNYLPDLRTYQGNWSNPQFHAVINRSDYQLLEYGWWVIPCCCARLVRRAPFSMYAGGRRVTLLCRGRLLP
jgi:hypothetical protein